MRNVSDKSCREFKTHILCSIFFFVSPENLAGYERMLNNKNRVGHKMTIWRMRIACWIPKATNTHSQYVILIALPQQQCLHERASLLGYRHTVRVCEYVLLFHSRIGYANAPEFHVILTLPVFSFIGKNSLHQLRLFIPNSLCFLTNSLDGGPSWEASNSSSVQELSELYGVRRIITRFKFPL